MTMTLLAAVERIRPVVEQGVEAGEACMTLPPATVNAMTESGLFRIKLPRVLGGWEADLLTQIAVIEAMSYVDAAAGWCLMIGATGLGSLGAFGSDEAVAAVFQAGRVPRTAGVFAPTGRATPVDGGYRLSGRWSFVSGVRHADRVGLAAVVPAAEGTAAPPQLLTCLLPTSSVQIHDNWDTIGLRGTGSCDVSVTDVFVPEAFAQGMRGEPRRGGALYRLGMPGYVAYEHGAFALGVARRALDTLVELAPSKHRGVPPSPLVERGAFQRDLGELALRLRAARALLLECNEEAWQVVTRGQTPDVRLQTALRGVSAYATDVALDVVTQAYRYVGGAAVYKPNLLERAVRDLHTATQHFIVSNSAYENYAKALLGMPDINPWS